MNSYIGNHATHLSCLQGQKICVAVAKCERALNKGVLGQDIPKPDVFGKTDADKASWRECEIEVRGMEAMLKSLNGGIFAAVEPFSDVCFWQHLLEILWDKFTTVNFWMYYWINSIKQLKDQSQLYLNRTLSFHKEFMHNFLLN